MSLRTEYDNVVIDVEGNALPDVEVTVYEEDGTTEATIYASRSGGGPLSNPLAADDHGKIQFFCEPGSYKLEFHDPELPARISDRTVWFEAVSGSVSGGIDETQLESGISGSKITNGSIALGKLSLSLGTGQILAGSGGTPTAVTMGGAASIGASGSVSLNVLSDYAYGPVGLDSSGANTGLCGVTLGAGSWLVFAKSSIVSATQLPVYIELIGASQGSLDYGEETAANPSGDARASLSVLSTANGGQGVVLYGKTSGTAGSAWNASIKAIRYA